MSDPIVEQIRAFRMEHTRKFNHDLAAICEDLHSIQARCGHRVVRLAPKKIQPTRASSCQVKRETLGGAYRHRNLLIERVR